MAAGSDAVALLDAWLAANRAAAPPAVVLGGSCNGLSFARSLGRRGVPVLVLDSERSFGTRSRYAKGVLLPPADQFEDEWLAFLDRLGSRLAVPTVLFPTGDLYSLLVARHRDALQRHYRFLIPELATLERIVNKPGHYAAARAAGIPIPGLRLPTSVADADAMAADVEYPCLLKPHASFAATGRLGRKVVVVHSREELVAEYIRITSMDIPLMIQEIIPGDDSAIFTHWAFWDANGRERAWVVKQKLRQYPPGFGDGSFQMTVDAPRVAELSRRLLTAMSYRGFVAVEFKWDARDDTYRLMEINPRTESGNQLAIAAGVDFPWIGYRYLTGADRSDEPATRGRIGVKYVNEEWDLKTYLVLRRSGVLSLAAWLKSLRGVEAWAISAWDDPMPILSGLWRFMRHTWSGLFSGSHRRGSSGDQRVTDPRTKIAD